MSHMQTRYLDVREPLDLNSFRISPALTIYPNILVNGFHNILQHG